MEEQIKEWMNEQVKDLSNQPNQLFPVQLLTCNSLFPQCLDENTSSKRYKKPPSNTLFADVIGFEHYLSSYVVIICFIFVL